MLTCQVGREGNNDHPRADPAGPRLRREDPHPVVSRDRPAGHRRGSVDLRVDGAGGGRPQALLVAGRAALSPWPGNRAGPRPLRPQGLVSEASLTTDVRPPVVKLACSASRFLPIYVSQTTGGIVPVSYTHLRAHETDSYRVCR